MLVAPGGRARLRARVVGYLDAAVQRLRSPRAQIGVSLEQGEKGGFSAAGRGWLRSKPWVCCGDGLGGMWFLSVMNGGCLMLCASVHGGRCSSG